MNQDNKQASRVALVTGAARRIGAAIAMHLHQAGFRVIIHCHQSEKAAIALAEKLNLLRKDSALVLCEDLCLKTCARSLITSALEWGGRLDLLVNNASIFRRDSADTNDWDALFSTNVQAPFQLSHMAYPHLAAHEGAIINITDIYAEKPLKGYSIYCQSKAALSLQTKALALEFAPKVRVNAIAPGAIAWPEQDNALSHETQQKVITSTPLKRHGSPLFIAEAVLLMAQNMFITGQTLNVDGGRACGYFHYPA